MIDNKASYETKSVFQTEIRLMERLKADEISFRIKDEKIASLSNDVSDRDEEISRLRSEVDELKAKLNLK